MTIFDGAKNIWNLISTFPDVGDVGSERQQYFDAIKKRTEYRAGEQKKQLASKFGKPDDNVRSNLIGKIVNQSIYLLLSSGVLFDLPGEKSEEQDWIDACWKANNKDILMTNLAMNAADAGTGYLKIIPDGMVGDKEVLYPRIVNLDPKNILMETNPEDFEQVIRYIITYQTVGPDEKPRLRREITEHIGAGYDEEMNVIEEGNYWLITNKKKDYGDPEWVVMSEHKWDYPFAPILNWQNKANPNSVYGEPDILGDVLELQDKRNFNASNINKIIRYHAHPKTYTINASLPKAKDGQNATWDSDQMLQFTGENPEVANLEMQSDLESSIVFYNLLGKQMFDQTSTVDVSNLKDKLGQLTNFSVQVLFQSALWKMNMKRKMFGHMLKELNFRLLTIAGMNPDSGVIIWPKVVLPTDERERIETQNMELMMGIVSKQTISVERNRDYEEEKKRIKKDPISDANIRVQDTKRVLNESNKAKGQKGQES